MYLLQPFYNVLLAWLLKWGVALHDLDLDAIRKGENSGPFHQQLGNVQRTILRLAFPGGTQRPKPGPYTGPRVRGSGEHETAGVAAS